MNPHVFLKLCIRNQHYALQLQRVQEIVSLSQFHLLPRPIHHIVGLVDLRHQIISVLYLDEFQPGQLQKATNRLVVLEANQKRFALLVDSVVNIDKIDEGTRIEWFNNDAENPTLANQKLWMIGIVQIKKTRYWLLSVDRLFSLL